MTKTSGTMYLAYIDESGDDGFPDTSSSLFVLTSLYLHHRAWKACFEAVQAFRRDLARTKILPFDTELHTRELLLDKDPYHAMKLPAAERLRLVRLYCELLVGMEIKVVNVAINKPAIIKPEYQILDTALTYLIQRLENDLRASDGRFMLITDEGRVGKMRATARRIQRFNYVPSKFGLEARRQDIQLMIEDPLPKKSHESHFIQLADMVACLVQLHLLHIHGLKWPNRLGGVCTHSQIAELLELIKPRLNLKAAPGDPFGIVCYPKK